MRVTSNGSTHGRKKKILKLAKGNFGNRKSVFKIAKETVERGLVNAYRGRRQRRRDFRSLWVARINAASRLHGVRYSEFMNALSRSNIALNRKILADIAVTDGAVFKKILDSAMTSA